MNLLSLFKKKTEAPEIRVQKRYFSASERSRLTDWVASYGKMNYNLKSELVPIVLHARAFAVNNELVCGILENYRRNVIGPDGFILQSKSKRSAQIEAEWEDYNSRSGGYLTFDHRQSGRDFDNLILRSIIVDGEAFIHREYDSNSKYGYRYELIDSLDIDPYYNEELPNGGRIVMGVELNAAGEEVAYWMREDRSVDFYFSGSRIRIPAENMIHVYRKLDPGQARGYSVLAPILKKINHLEAYEEAEIVHARAQSCVMGIWEKTGTAGDIMDETNANGEIASTLEPGSFKFAPEGYSPRFLQNSSPSANFANFWKNLTRTIANAIGLSYNKASGDYESVNYSSLREASLEDRATYEELQKFFIENWKDIQFRDFLRIGILTGRYSPKTNFGHRFFGRRFQWVDPLKEISALEKEFSLGLTDPITEIEKRGFDPDEIIERTRLWQEKCRKAGITFNLNSNALDANILNEEE